MNICPAVASLQGPLWQQHCSPINKLDFNPPPPPPPKEVGEGGGMALPRMSGRQTAFLFPEKLSETHEGFFYSYYHKTKFAV